MSSVTTTTEPVAALAVEPVLPLRTETRRLLILAAPMIGTMISRMAMGFIDFAMVSRLGTEATAAISPSTLLVFSVLCLGMGAATSIQTFAAQALGRREPRQASAYAWQGFYIAALFGLITWPVTLLVDPFWATVGHPDLVFQMEVDYCRIAFWSMACSILCAALDGFFNGVQRPGVALMSVLVSLGFNVVANYCLIFGKFGFPAMGIRGAALATVIAWGIRAGMLTAVFLGTEFHRAYATRATWRLDLRRFRDVVRIGGPIAMQWVLDIGAWFVFLTLLMGRFGTVAMAASNIALQYMHLSFMPAIGFGTAVCSVVGHAIGENRPELALRRARIGMMLNGIYMGLVGLIFLAARTPLMELMSADPAVIHIGAGVLIWAAIFQVFDAAGITYMNALRGAGDTRWPAIVVALHCWVILVGGGYAMAVLLPGFSFHGPWMMCTLYIILLGLALWQRFVRGGWRKINLFGDAAPPRGFPIGEGG